MAASVASIARIRVVQRPTPNYRKGRRDVARGAVIHITEGTAEGTRSWFAAERSKVSAHFQVCLDGTIDQFVSVHDEAWHAGVIDRPTWRFLRGKQSPNSYMLGIEHEGSGLTPWTEEQLLASTILSAWLGDRFRWKLDGSCFTPHHPIRASKSCPGPAFDLDGYLVRLRAAATLLPIGSLITGIR